MFVKMDYLWIIVKTEIVEKKSYHPQINPNKSTKLKKKFLTQNLNKNTSNQMFIGQQDFTWFS